MGKHFKISKGAKTKQEIDKYNYIKIKTSMKNSMAKLIDD